MRVLALLPLLAAAPLSAADSTSLFAAIRTGNPATVNARIQAGVDKEAPNPDGLTPLIYAITTAGTPVIRLLLDSGVNVNAATANGVTALHVAAFDAAKVRLLLERGANVNATTANGETPLYIAADRPGNHEVVDLLIAGGANPSAGAGSAKTALNRAAANGDAALMRLLLSKGAKVSGSLDLARFACYGRCPECLELALAGGAAPNGASGVRSALQDAAGLGDLDMVRMLVEKGADVQAADARGYTALMRAALSYEPGAGEVVDYLLARGANTDPKNETGETALSFALRFGDTPIVAKLRAAGAPDAKTAIRVPPPLEENTVRGAIERSLPLLQRIGEPVYKLRSCTSCHHNTLPALTVAMARTRGLAVDDALARKEYENAIESARGRRGRTNILGIGVADINAYPLMGIAAESQKPTPSTDLMVHQVTTRQEPNGRFRSADYRPPQEYSPITFTATALRALQLFPLPGRAAEFKDRIRRASQWLVSQRPRDTEEHALRLMGLSWAGAGKPARDKAVKALLALQREDGGWAQTALLDADAYATGQSLYALYLAGVRVTDPAYKRGVAFLLKTQRKNGSWFVISRSYPVQPLMDAGYPYVHHQWISAAAGAWSTIALLATMPTQTAASR